MWGLTEVSGFDSFIIAYGLATVTGFGGNQGIKMVENLAQNQIGEMNCYWNGGFLFPMDD